MKIISIILIIVSFVLATIGGVKSGKYDAKRQYIPNYGDWMFFLGMATGTLMIIAITE